MDKRGCYIVGAGERIEHPSIPGEGGLLIAADGGYCWLRELKLVPDIVVGDFDSMGEAPKHPNMVRLPKEKDETDMMAAIRLGRERGMDVFHIYGGTGGRFDHTVANLQILSWLSRRGAQGYLYGRGWTATAITDGTLTFPAERRGMISVFAQTDTAEGVFLEGLKYPLADAVLANDFALGVSNEFTGAAGRITVGKGTLLVVWEEA